MKQLLRAIHKRVGLRTRLRRFRKARSFIRRYRPLVGLRRAITYWRWTYAPASRRRIDHNGRSFLCRFGPGQSDLYIWGEVFCEQANDCVDLETASWIIDAGANVGYTAIWFAERYPSSQIIAVEPDAENFEILCLNVAHEPRIIPVRAAITQPGAPPQFVIGGPTDTSPCAFQTVDFDPTARDVNEADVVDAVDIASLMEQFGIERLDLLKMDIEGGEQAVFGECADWIDRVEAIIVEVHDRFVPGCSATFDRATKDFAVRDVGPEGSFRVYVRRGTPTVAA
jgi:FkbM family methyltransferase